MNGQNSDQPIVILITAPSVEVGKKIAMTLLEQRLAACVNILSPVNSLYLWQEEIHDDQEVLLIVKSRMEIFEDRLRPVVRSVHPYATPEIIALSILAGDQAYLDWIAAETRRPGSLKM
jgi:periplasmic divalent cation tolerance protein